MFVEHSQRLKNLDKQIKTFELTETRKSRKAPTNDRPTVKENHLSVIYQKSVWSIAPPKILMSKYANFSIKDDCMPTMDQSINAISAKLLILIIFIRKQCFDLITRNLKNKNNLFSRVFTKNFQVIEC